MKKIFILITLVAVCNSGFAQSKYTDSLNIELTKAKDDTSRVLILANLAYYHRYQNLDTGMAYAQQALSLAQKIKFLRGQSIAFQNIGIIYRYLGNFSMALENTYNGFQIAEENNFITEKAFSLMRIGAVFNSLGDYKKAISFYHKAFQIVSPEKKVRANAVNWLNFGITFSLMNQLDSAWYYEKKAYDNLHLLNDLAPDVCRTLGTIQMKKRDQFLARQFFHESLEASEKTNDEWAASATYAEMAKMYIQEGNTDSSIYFAKKGLDYAQRAKNPRTILTCGDLLAEMLELSNAAEAFYYYKIAAAAKESLFGAGNLQAIQALVVKEEERRNEIVLAEAAYRAKIRQYGLLSGLGGILLITFILFGNNRQKQKTNLVLQEQKQKVETTLQELKQTQTQLIQSEKMASLGELTAGIAHEIQNPLNFVNNFSEVNMELIDELKTEVRSLATLEMTDKKIEMTEQMIDDIKANSEKINHHGKRAADIVKGMLQHSRSSSGVKEPTDFNALCDEYLRLSYHGLRAKDKTFNATLKTDFDNSIGNINIIPQDIGRVVMNLLTNAFYSVGERLRQAQPDKTNVTQTDNTDVTLSAAAESKGYEPKVSISTKKINDKVEIKVTDNGNGIPHKVLDKIFQPFFTTKPTGQGTGLGLSLSYDIIKAHGGKLNVETKEGDGTSFIISLPI